MALTGQVYSGVSCCHWQLARSPVEICFGCLDGNGEVGPVSLHGNVYPAQVVGSTVLVGGCGGKLPTTQEAIEAQLESCPDSRLISGLNQVGLGQLGFEGCQHC